MNRIALAAALSFLVGGVAQARLIDLTPAPSARTAPVFSHGSSPPRQQAPQPGLLLAGRLPELPEPEVFAMMLVGLVLIGYRAKRESSEKFK